MSRSYLLTAIGIIAAGMASQAAGAVIYSQTFENSAGANQPLTALNSGANTWKAYGKSTAVDKSTGTDTYTYPVLSGSKFLFVQSSSPELTPALVYVNGSFRTVAEAQTSTFDVRNETSSGAVPVRFAIQVQTGPSTSSWFATQTTYTSATNTTWESKTVNFATATWYGVTLNPGTALSMSTTPVTLPAGTVTALGWYNNAGVNNWRVDNLQYSAAIPEPTCLAAVGLMGLLALRRRSH